MDVRADQFPRQLETQPLARCYLLAGDEPLQVLEAADALRAAARSQGYDEREVLHAEAGFDWGQLASAGASLSLFSDKRILELHLTDKGPGKPGSAALIEYAKNAPDSTLLIVIATPLAASARKSAWYKAIAKAGVVMYAWPLPAARMAQWIEKRAAGHGLRMDADAVALLAEHTEGNLLAAAQEIDRLALLHADTPIGSAEIAAAASDHARFDIFDLPAKALAGDRAGALHSLSRLRAEGVDAVPITWALVREVRLVYQAALAARANRLDAMLGKVFMPPARKRQIAQAAAQADPARLAVLLRDASRLDQANKGARPGRPWDELVRLTLGLAGVDLPVSSITTHRP
ncbi:DNA polymerase III subunit delta [Salinisphaera sp. T31B1]|uniref:DNA polymerase III subunit delta n=1 Tax=Salinisphaera sp. T31B1 TaxID=727963 RepID=UPI00334075F8